MRYTDRIKHAETRQEAADLMRAHATQYVASAAGKSMKDSARVSVIETVERQAQQLLSTFTHDPDGYPIAEADHPWRDWLREWGWLR